MVCIVDGVMSEGVQLKVGTAKKSGCRARTIMNEVILKHEGSGWVGGVFIGKMNGVVPHLERGGGGDGRRCGFI